METLSPLIDRFVRYCRVDTQADPESDSVPSTEKQKDLGRMLVAELLAMGVEGAAMDEADADEDEEEETTPH